MGTVFVELAARSAAFLAQNWPYDTALAVRGGLQDNALMKEALVANVRNSAAASRGRGS